MQWTRFLLYTRPQTPDQSNPSFRRGPSGTPGQRRPAGRSACLKKGAPRARRVNQTVRNAPEAPRGLVTSASCGPGSARNEVYRLDPSRIPDHLVSSDKVRGNRKKLCFAANLHRMR